MTKIEELKVAFDASTPGEWAIGESFTEDTAIRDVDGECIVTCLPTIQDEQETNAKFIALAHNAMPQLLELVDTLGEYLRRCTVDDEDRWITREVLHEQMKKLKGS